MSFYTNVEKVFQDWNYGHPKVLYGLIRSMKPDVVVEVGTYRGYGAAWMAKALQENNKGRLYAIDNFSLTDHTARYGDAKKHLMENLAKCGVADFVSLIEGDSTKVKWPEKIDFAYIDGWHGFEIAQSDFDNCSLFGAECICLDDTTQSIGPRMVVENARKSGEWDVIDVLRDCGMAICMRKKEKGVITFSQELPHSTGVDLQLLTKKQQKEHFADANALNGVKYDHMMPLLTKGVK